MAPLAGADSQAPANMDFLLEAQDRDPVISQLKDWKKLNRTEPPAELLSESTSGHSGKCGVHYK